MAAERNLERELEQLRPRRADLERSVAELLRLSSPQAALVSESLDKVTKKIASLERRLRVLRGEPEPLALKPKLNSVSVAKAASRSPSLPAVSTTSCRPLARVAQQPELLCRLRTQQAVHAGSNCRPAG
jgi:hypothetical protein